MIRCRRAFSAWACERACWRSERMGSGAAIQYTRLIYVICYIVNTYLWFFILFPLLGRFAPPLPCPRLVQINACQQQRQFLSHDSQRARFARLGPGKAAFAQPLGADPNPGSVEIEQLDPVLLAIGKEIKMTDQPIFLALL